MQPIWCHWEEFGKGYAEEASITYPQSGERFVGRENILGLVGLLPPRPGSPSTRFIPGGELVVVDVGVDYGSGPAWKACFLYGLTDGLIRWEVAYFSAPFEAAEWRGSFREK